MSWGVKWVPLGVLQPVGPQAFVSVRFGAGHKRDKFVKTLSLASIDMEQEIHIESIPGWPHEAHLSQQLTGETVPDQLEQTLEVMITAFLTLIKKSGGLKVAIGS